MAEENQSVAGQSQLQNSRLLSPKAFRTESCQGQNVPHFKWSQNASEVGWLPALPGAQGHWVIMFPSHIVPKRWAAAVQSHLPGQLPWWYWIWPTHWTTETKSKGPQRVWEGAASQDGVWLFGRLTGYLCRRIFHRSTLGPWTGQDRMHAPVGRCFGSSLQQSSLGHGWSAEEIWAELWQLMTDGLFLLLNQDILWFPSLPLNQLGGEDCPHMGPNQSPGLLGYSPRGQHKERSISGSTNTRCHLE